jgi:hypothetical protein
MRILTPGPIYVLIAAASLAACADHPDVRSFTYDYAAPDRKVAEWRAHLAMQDSCFASGYQWARNEGPPQVANGEAGKIQATQAFSCVGTVGGP